MKILARRFGDNWFNALDPLDDVFVEGLFATWMCGKTWQWMMLHCTLCLRMTIRNEYRLVFFVHQAMTYGSACNNENKLHALDSRLVADVRPLFSRGLAKFAC